MNAVTSTNWPPDQAVDHAIFQAKRATCAKSRRGCVVIAPAGCLPRPRPEPSLAGTLYTYDGWVQLGGGCNGQPDPYVCAGKSICGEACRMLAIHAEDRAIRAAIEQLAVFYDTDLATIGRAELVHVKVDEDGLLVAGGGPSCVQCSKLILDAPIAGVWLYEEADTHTAGGGIWQRYHSTRFHQVTLATLGLERHTRVDES